MEITPEVTMLESSRRSHVYLVRTEETALIDTGMPGGAAAILTELAGLGIHPADIKKILLTHHDVDHMGSAKKLQEATGAEVWASEEDLPYVTGERNRPGVKHLIQVLTRPQVPKVAGSYSDRGEFGGIAAIFAPGHTPGHTIFRFKDVLLTGDLFRNVGGRPSVTPGVMTWNREAAVRSLTALREMEFRWACPAHGDPVQNGPAFRKFLDGMAKGL